MYLPIAGTSIGSSVWWTTRVGTRTVGSSARTSTSDNSGIMRATVPGLAARRSIRANVARISSFHGMSGFKTCCHSPVPHIAAIAALTSSRIGDARRIRVALEHDQRGGARRMCRCEQRPRRERAVAGEEDRFANSEIVEHRGDAVGPLLQGRHRARRDGIGRSRARLVEEDQPTERCRRLDPPLKGR